MPTDLERVVSVLDGADSYVDVFGVCDGDVPSQKAHVKRIFRQIARTVHPDRHHGQEVELASKAFVLLQKYEKQAATAIEQGTYGQRPGMEIKTRRFVHRVSQKIASGDIATLLAAETRSAVDTGGTAERTIVKVARSPRDNDLIAAEATALRKLRSKGSDESLHPYVPRLFESLRLSSSNLCRQANVIGYLPGFYDLEQVRQVYSGGVEPADMAWMWRRLLVAIGFAHEQNLIHGSILPPHIMIWPEKHGLVLVDWTYSVSSETDELPAIKAISPKYRDWYPKEVMRKQSPSNGTDIGMAAMTMIYLLGGDPASRQLPKSVPKPFRAFFRGSTLDNQYARPQNAWALLKEFDELLESIGEPYYPRRFKEFTMPAAV